MSEKKSVRLTLAEIREILSCSVLSGEEKLGLEIETVAATDGMSALLAGVSRGSLLITGLANIQSVRTGHVADVAAIIYIRNVRPTEQTIELARSKGIVLLSTSLGMFPCCGILYSRGLKGVI
jgi:predicted transcriptional regulator